MPWLLANFRAPFCAASWIRVFSFSQPVQQANGISHLEISSNFRQSHDFANRCESLRYKKHSPAILTKQFSDKSRRVLPSVHRLAGGCSGRFLPRLTVLAWMLSTFLFSGVLHAQNSPSDVVGIPPDAAMYPIPGLGVVNLNSGNLHIELPIWKAKERNGSVLTTSITYDSSGFHLIAQQEGLTTQYYWSNLPGQNVGWVSSLGVTQDANGAGTIQRLYSFYYCGNSQIPQYTDWQYIDGHGTIHPFSSAIVTEQGGQSGCPDEPNAQGMATDGSGFWLEVSNYNSAVVYDMHGNAVSVGKDANGNFSPSLTQDQLGRTLSYLPSGFTSTSSTVNIWTNFGSGNSQSAEIGPVSSPVLSSINLPDGRSYSFQYDDAGPPNGQGVYASSQQGHYGSLTGITLPNGGHISIINEVVPGTTSSLNTNLVVKQITTPDGTWNFTYMPGIDTVTAPPDPLTGLASQTTVSIPANIQVSTLAVSTYAGAASGTPLRTITVQNPSRPTNITTTLDNGQSSSIAYTYADLCSPRVATKKEHDFSGNLLRETDISYPTSASDNATLCAQYAGTGGPTWTSSYLQNNHFIIAIPSSITVYGPSGSNGPPISQTNFTYDSTTLSTTSGSAGSSVSGLQTVSGVAIHDDSNFGASMTMRGNPTVISQMLGSGFLTTQTNYYNILGELIKTIDGNGNATTFDFTDNWSNASCISAPVFAYPTTTTNALGQVGKTSYNSCDGTVASVQDQNDINASRAGTTTSYDARQRVTRVSYPDNGYNAFDYGGFAVPEVITETIALTTSASETKTTTLDLLGRVVQTQLTSDPSGTDIVDSTYDDLGRLYTVSNPYRAPKPAGITTTLNYDALGRKTLQTQQDGSTQQWNYSGNITTFSDENSNSWQHTYDAMGNLIGVTEPNGASASYTYNALGNLVTVDQPGLSASGEVPRATRTFTYDSLSRPVQAYNPESGWTCYGTTGGAAPDGTNCTSGYDSNGNLTAKVDARGKTVNYNYDQLNRLTGKTYSDSTPPVSYNYDEKKVSWSPATISNPVGRLTSTSVGGVNVFSRYGYLYDPMGRILYQIFQTPNSAGNGLASGVGSASYTYDRAGNVTFVDSGKGVQFTLTRDNAGHVTAARSNKHTTGTLNGTSSYQLFANATYTPWGAPFGRLLGNGLTESKTYDNRERLLSSSQFQAGSTVGYSVSANYYPNGNVQTSNDSVNGNWTYGYDPENRLGSAVSSAGLNLAWTYDSFGNREAQTASGTGSAPQPSFTFSGNNNQADASGGLLYDAAGNIVTDNLGQNYAYDAEGRISSVSGAGANAVYQYDSDGQLVYENGSHGVQVFVRDAAGRATNIFNPTPNGPPYSLISAYIDGEHIGSWQHDRFLWTGSDWLGTKRYESGGNGDIGSTASPYRWASYTSLPFGDALSSIGTDPTHFTGKERDAESGNDYFGARYYASSMGRFMSPDPAGPWAADVSDPQSWNFYAYARNNPLINIDPNGYDCVYLNNAGNGVESVDQNSSQTECMGDGKGNKGTGGYWVDGTATSGTYNPNNNDITLNGYEAGPTPGTGQLTGAAYTSVTASTADSVPNMFVFSPTQALPPAVLSGMISALNFSGQSDKLVGCIVSTESGGKPGAANSGSTAKGLMQVLKGGAADVAQHGSGGTFQGMNGKQLYAHATDPAANIATGTALLKLKVGYAKGNVQKGLDMYGTGAPYGQNRLACANKP